MQLRNQRFEGGKNSAPNAIAFTDVFRMLKAHDSAERGGSVVMNENKDAQNPAKKTAAKNQRAQFFPREINQAGRNTTASNATKMM